MNIVDRWNRILEMLSERDYVTVDALVEGLPASPATVRRDLKAMEADGLLARFRGGAKPITQSYKTAFSIDKRLASSREAKLAICRAAARTVQDGDYIYIDAASTTYFLPDFITAHGVTVVTNSVPLLQKLLERRINTYALGGTLDFEGGAIQSSDTIDTIRSMNFDKVFIGTYGIDLDRGFTTYRAAEGELKRHLFERGKQSYALADASKFDVSAFYTFGPLDAAIVVCDHMPKAYEGRIQAIVCGETTTS